MNKLLLSFLLVVFTNCFAHSVDLRAQNNYADKSPKETVYLKYKKEAGKAQLYSTLIDSIRIGAGIVSIEHLISKAEFLITYQTVNKQKLESLIKRFSERNEVQILHYAFIGSLEHQPSISKKKTTIVSNPADTIVQVVELRNKIKLMELEGDTDKVKALRDRLNDLVRY